MIKNIFLDTKWQKEHLKKIKKRAGSRYTPELNVNLPIAEIFDGICRSENFYITIRRHYGNLNREFSYVSIRHENKDIQKLYENLNDNISQLSKILDKIKKYNIKKIPWDKINIRVKKAKEILWELLNKLREERNKVGKSENKKTTIDQRSISEKLSSDIYYLYEVHRELRYFDELSASTKAKLSNFPFLFLTGIAGIGKTHLLCDVVDSRFANKEVFPAVLVFGELFLTPDDPLIQTIRQLNLKIDVDQFLHLLNSAGKKSGCRAILAIDALNETRQRDFWKKSLSKVIDKIKKYPNIALVVSVRTGFEREVITNKLKKVFIHEDHRGFKFREWEAVSKFFREFNLPLPEIPLLMPEFQHPLFLLLFCKAFDRRVKKNKGKAKKQVFRGHEGATYVFESFVDNISKKIYKQFKITNSSKNIWDMVIEKIAAEMVSTNNDRISENQMIQLVKNAYPSIDHNKFAKELERNFLIVKVPRYSIEKNDYIGFDFKFPFQKFSDHLIGRYLFKKYEQEFGKTNKNISTAKKFFSKRRKLGKYLSNTWNRGIVEALSVQCPEHLKGCEFVEIASYLKNSDVAQEAFVESIIWRKPTAFSEDKKNTLKYINNKIITTELGLDNLLNAFLSVAPIPDHPFNADFLHKWLSKFSMPKRDSWWSTFLHYQYGEKGAVDRLVEWGWSDQDKTHINDEGIHLCSVILCWFLTTPNRLLRDRTTKALVSLLTNRIPVVLKLLKQFKNVNDPYVAERLYAVAYGCALRNRSDRKGIEDLSKWVYEEIFRNDSPPVHILLRDYARGIIEVGLYEEAEIKIDQQKIKPPFNSDWPNRIPSERLLKRKYYPEEFFLKKTEERGFLDIWSSVMGVVGDFKNYVINPKVGHWSGRRLNGKEVNRKKLFGDFKSGLTKQQKELLEKATNPFFGIDLLSVPTYIRYVFPNEEKDQRKEMKNAYTNFENSLSEYKKRFFCSEIKPFLDKHGSINDPFDHFDTGLAQRWIFNRVVQLGWKQKLHGPFDREVNYFRINKYDCRLERIGKKYQWIALHELLARISDNFEFKEESWSAKIRKFEGPWQLRLRDIDPSCTLKGFSNKIPEGMPIFNKRLQDQYSSWNKEILHSMWLEEVSDLPNPKQIIEFSDGQGNCWLGLEGFVEWQEGILPEQERCSLPRRALWYMLKSYLVCAKDLSKVFKWAKQQRFMGRWMPESNGFDCAYLGEYPWAPSFLYHYISYSKKDGWTTTAKGGRIPTKILVTNDQYISNGSSIDFSTNEAIRVKLPAKFLVDEMNLTQSYTNGIFFGKNGELIAFDPSVFDDNMPGYLFIRKDKLVNFLKCKGYSLFWTLLGKKNIISGDIVKQPLGCLEINGVYTFDEQNKIVGASNNHFKKI